MLHVTGHQGMAKINAILKDLNIAGIVFSLPLCLIHWSVPYKNQMYLGR